MLNLCFTADHELFTGINLMDESEVMIKPTDHLLRLLETYEIPLTLMTDVCSIWRYREVRPESSFADDVEEQLRRAIDTGHDVQLHIHPHWLTSEYFKEGWQFDHERFRIHALGFGEKKDISCDLSAEALIRKGKQYLEGLLKPVDPLYRCIGFRAGGWCIQPEREVLEALRQEGIRIDSTVYKGGFQNNGVHYFDFRKAPNQSNWWVDPEKGISTVGERSEKALHEICIGSYDNKSMLWYKKLCHKFYCQQVKEKAIPRGFGYEPTFDNKVDALAYKAKNFFLSPLMLSFDDACSVRMTQIVKHYLDRIQNSDEEYYLAIIGHPKSIGEPDFKEIELFCKEMKNKYAQQVTFKSMSTMAEMLGL